jgi:glyoxylate carboligase
MARLQCAGCKKVGGVLPVNIDVERADIRRRFTANLCITCTVGFTTWLTDVSTGWIDDFSLVPKSNYTRSVQRRARSTRAYRKVSVQEV